MRKRAALLLADGAFCVLTEPPDSNCCAFIVDCYGKVRVDQHGVVVPASKMDKFSPQLITIGPK